MAKILVVDDEEFFRMILEDMLVRGGHRVFKAENGRQALALAERENPDVVLLDYILVDETGLDVLVKLQAGYPTIPVIIVTADGHVEPAVKLMKAGARDYVIKPFEKEVILRKVAAVIGR